MTNYPVSIDSFTNPTPGTTEGSSSRVSDSVGGYTHAQMHGAENDVLEALQAKVGIDGSAVTTSHDYKLSGVTGSDKAASLTGSEVLSGKTLTAPKIADTGFIADNNGNEQIKFSTTASAVNEITVKNAAAGSNPQIQSTGGDTDVGLDLLPKAAGTVNIKGNGTQAGTLRLYEDTDDGSNYSSFKVGTQAGNVDYTLPTAQGASNTVLTNNGSGVLSWGAAGSTSSVSVVPYPNWFSGAASGGNFGVNTTLNLGQVRFPFAITANKLSINIAAVGTAGTLKIALFSENGQTQLFSITTSSISGTGINTTALSAVNIPAGVYYIATLPVGTADITTNQYGATISQNFFDAVSSEPILQGTLTVTASTMPATITPTSITYAANVTLIARFDN